MSDKSVLINEQISSSRWKLVPVEPTEEMLNSVEAHLRDAHDTVSNLQGELLAQADMRRVLGEREAEIQ